MSGVQNMDVFLEVQRLVQEIIVFVADPGAASGHAQ